MSMRRRQAQRFAPTLAGALMVLAAFVFQSPVETVQRGRTAAAAPKIPPLSMTCPMHPDVVDSQAGTCPICKMNLVPVRLESIWTCPIHAVISESKPGLCPIDRRQLIQVTVAVTWTCRAQPDVNHLEPGTCSDGSAMVVKRTLRPHGNHNPQHGGQFFMAPDNWTHLEGVYPRDRLFRVYLYDDYAKPLPPDRMKQVVGRVVTKETFDPKTRVTTEISAFPLVRSITGSYLEARIDPVSLPAQMTAKLKVKSGDPEYRFDFTFTALTQDPMAPVTSSARSAVSPSSTAKPARSAPAVAPPRGQPAKGSSAPPAETPTKAPPAETPTEDRVEAVTPPPPAAAPVQAVDPQAAFIDPATLTVPIPETVGEMLVQLKARRDEIGGLIQDGNFGAVYVPAFQAKDLAIALETRLTELPADKRQQGEPAIQRLVRTAWLLDAFGDLGNRQQLTDAYSAFTSNVADVLTAFGERP